MSLLLEAIVKPSLLLAVAWLATAILRRRSASTRHWILATALVCAAVSPLVSAVVPAWPIEVMREAIPFAPQTQVPSTPGRVPVVDDGVRVAVAVVTAPNVTPGGSLLTWVRLIWLVGVCFGLATLAVGRHRLAGLASRSEEVLGGPWPETARVIAARYGLRVPVRVIRGPHPTLLATWGVLEPTVCIPSAATGWTAERIQVVLGHELAHIRRCDWAVQMTAAIIRSIYWFNPLMWLACRSLRQLSEQACDDAVLASGVNAPAYGKHLLDLARSLRVERPAWTPALGIVRPSGLERRFTAMLDENTTRTPMTLSTSVITVALLLAALVAVAPLQIGAQTFSTLSGTVVDPQGRLLPVAKVALVRGPNNARYEVDTDANGRYEFVGLVPGDYAIQVSRPAFKLIQDRLSVSGGSLTRDFTMDIGTLQETITVTGGPSSSPRRTATDVPSVEDFRRRFSETLASCDPADQGATVGGRIRPPRKIKDVRPIYPEGLRSAGIGGAVQMEAVVGVDGRVREIRPQEGQAADPGLVAAAMDAVSQWEFDGTLLNCVPVEVSMIVSVSFGPE